MPRRRCCTLPARPKDMPTPASRRHLLVTALASPLLLAARPVRSADTQAGEFAPGSAIILVAGPQGGRLDRIAETLVGPLEHGLSLGAKVAKQTVGGVDGVTGANQFDARVSPDGQTALLFPPEAVFAWLAGDPRAKFDPSRWVPVLSGIAPSVIVGRVPVASLVPGSRLRIGGASPAGPDLAALLALELLGIEAVPVFGFQSSESLTAAFANHTIDAVFLRGPDAAARLDALAAAGGHPEIAVATGESPDSALMVGVPTVAALLSARGLSTRGPMLDAWKLMAAAARVDFTLALPQLAPAAQVSLWRRAAVQAVAAPDLAIVANGVVPLAGPAVPAMALDSQTLLELRRWLAGRFNWQPT